MDIIICWIGICICSFYIIRAYWAGYVAFPFARRVAYTWNVSKLYRFEKITDYRNFYLWVLCPFWWGWSSCYKYREDRSIMRELWKVFCEKTKNLRK